MTALEQLQELTELVGTGPGWDQQVRTAIVNIVADDWRNHPILVGSDKCKTEAFLAVMIHLYEVKHHADGGNIVDAHRLFSESLATTR